MDPEPLERQTCELMGLIVPESLCDLVETWSRHTGYDEGDILRSVLNLGLARYLEMFPDSARLMAKALDDLDAMAPEQAQHEKLRAVETADGRLRLQQQDARKPDAVTIEVAVQPRLAAILKRHAELAETTVSEMLVCCWCAEALRRYSEAGDLAAGDALLMAWREQGVPDYVWSILAELKRDGFPTDTTVAH